MLYVVFLHFMCLAQWGLNLHLSYPKKRRPVVRFIAQKLEVVVANRELKFRRPQLIVELRDTPVELEAQLKTLDGKTKDALLTAMQRQTR